MKKIKNEKFKGQVTPGDASQISISIKLNIQLSSKFSDISKYGREVKTSTCRRFIRPIRGCSDEGEHKGEVVHNGLKNAIIYVAFYINRFLAIYESN